MECIKCSGPVTERYRLVWDKSKKTYSHLCDRCSRTIEALVAENGTIGLLSLDNPRFVCWLEEDRFMSFEEFLGIQGEGPEKA